MASSCPPHGVGHAICRVIQWPAIGPSSVNAGQVINHAVGSVTSSALHGIANAMASAADGLLKTLSAMWMNVNTPNLSAAANLQTYTRWITTAVAVVCILIAAGQMALRRRSEPVQVMLTGLARVVITGAAATFLVQTAASLADQFSSDMMNSTVAHIGGGGWSGIISTTAIASIIAPGDAMTVIIALLIIISSLIQLMLMILRVGLLVVLTGTLPLAAAASMSDWGQTWWRKHLGWLAAWLLYKPAAALLYVAAFRLTQGNALVPVLAGFMILVLSVLILPALLRVIVPATASLGAASGGALAMAAAGALATGAIRAGLHKPPIPAGKKGSSAPGDDGGPSGAEATTGGDPPHDSPPSSPERRSPIPTATGSADGLGGSGNSPGADRRGSNSAKPDAASSGSANGGSADSQSGDNRAGKAATFATGLAAGISACSPAWRSREDLAGGEAPQNEEPLSARKKPRPTGTDGGPSGATDQGGDDSPQENGG